MIVAQILTTVAILLAMVATDEVYAQPDPMILSAYLGIADTATAGQFQQVTECMAGDSPQTMIDGMPITFNVPVDPATISPDKFEITSNDDSVHTPTCATIRPADPTGTTELFTVLLTGEFASANRDDPSTPIEEQARGGTPIEELSRGGTASEESNFG